jgi:peptidoglycan/LPS O-acetylase OafA/YrhL
MQRIPQLDGLRALAILMVFAAHALRVPLLWTGVDLFFVLSGYLITRVLLQLKEQRKRDGYWAPFYLRRARRILPAYILFLAVMAIAGTPWLRSWYWYVLFCANVGVAFHKVQIEYMTQLWSLAVEEQFYLLWPCIVLACSPRMLKRVAVLILVASPVLRAFATPLFSDHFPIYCLTLFRSDVLAMGAWIAVFERMQPDSFRNKNHAALATMLAAAGIFAALSLFPDFRTGVNSVLFNSLGYSLSVLFFGGMVVYASTARAGVARSQLTLPPVRYLARISYAFYLWHLAVLALVERYIAQSAFVVTISFLATLAIAAFSWQFFESVILNLSLRRVAHSEAPKIPAAA